MKNYKIGYGPRTVDLTDGRYLHFYYANNRGRGDSNCSIILTTNPQRVGTTKKQIAAGYEAVATTSSWNGKVNFSLRIQRLLGL